MKFDIVIGNPPYNRGADIDFVHLAYQLSTKYVCMITPAKWQTAEADQKIVSTMSYGQFRELIVPHMKYVCFYTDCLDVFGISQADGISYYIIDKNNTYENRCIIENRCNLQPIINSTIVRDITHRQTLWNIGQEIIEYLGNYTKYIIKPITKRKEYTVNINKQLMHSLTASGAWDWNSSNVNPDCIGYGGFLFNKKGSLLVLNKTRFLQGDTVSDVSASKDMFTSDSLVECNSFYYWINTKFVRFFILINISSLTILNNNTFRFVPQPVINTDGSYNWNIKYTDEGLYVYYNLPQKYRDIINSVIKERK